jgi:hypothetical protein
MKLHRATSKNQNKFSIIGKLLHLETLDEWLERFRNLQHASQSEPPKYKPPEWAVYAPGVSGKFWIDMDKAAADKGAYWSSESAQKEIQEWKKSIEEKGATILRKPDGTTFRVVGKPSEDNPFAVVGFSPPAKSAAPSPKI